MGNDRSFSQFLQSLNEEDGLIAEIDFRRHHFESMAAWPTNHPHIRVYRYEDILGREDEVFREIWSFYGSSWLEKTLGLALANRFSATGKSKLASHIRNPQAGQWSEKFTPRVRQHFEKFHGDLLRQYGYA